MALHTTDISDPQQSPENRSDGESMSRANRLKLITAASVLALCSYMGYEHIEAHGVPSIGVNIDPDVLNKLPAK